MNKYEVTLIACELIDELPIIREYPIVTGIIKAFGILSDEHLSFCDKPISVVVFDKIVTIESYKAISFKLIDANGHFIGSAFIRQV